MIELLLPGAVESVEAFFDEGLLIHVEEERHVARAVLQRRQEFSTVRRCARTALGRLGFAPGPLVPGTRGAPIWPAGVVGSMTHCTGYRAAAVARVSDVAALGLDAEPNERLPEAGLLDVVASRREQSLLAELARAHPGVAWDRLLFSAKESVFKAWYPSTRRELGFADADVELDAGTSTFTADLRVPDAGPFTRLTGRWEVGRGVLATAVWVAP